MWRDMCRAEICDEDFLSRNTRRLRRPRRDRLDTSDSRDGPATSNCFPKLQSFSVSESETRRRSPSRSPRHKNRPRQAVKSPNPGFWWAKCSCAHSRVYIRACVLRLLFKHGATCMVRLCWCMPQKLTLLGTLAWWAFSMILWSCCNGASSEMKNLCLCIDVLDSR